MAAAGVFSFCLEPSDGFQTSARNAKTPAQPELQPGFRLRAACRGYGAETDFTTGATTAVLAYFAQKPNQRAPPGGMVSSALLAFVV